MHRVFGIFERASGILLCVKLAAAFFFTFVHEVPVSFVINNVARALMYSSPEHHVANVVGFDFLDSVGVLGWRRRNFCSGA